MLRGTYLPDPVSEKKVEKLRRETNFAMDTKQRGPTSA